jgi:hypothetical protein
MENNLKQTRQKLNNEAEHLKQVRQKLNTEIEQLNQNLREKEYLLNAIDKKCSHMWGETIPDHIEHKAHTIPGDPPGTMGVDWRGPINVPAKTEERWKRICKICGKIEYSKETTEQVIHAPKFST